MEEKLIKQMEKGFLSGLLINLSERKMILAECV